MLDNHENATDGTNETTDVPEAAPVTTTEAVEAAAVEAAAVDATQTAEATEATKEVEVVEVAEVVEAGPTFYDLPLAPEVQAAASKAGYTTPSPIQMEIIPHLVEGRDVLAQSQTGTGKTAAFAMPILSRIEIRKGAPQVLVLAPTRELAIQVSESFEKYAICQPGFNVATIYGGQSYDVQLRKLRKGVQVVVGTPGRVIDHIKRETLNLSHVKCLVLDEADEMLNMGFLEDVQFVLKQIPDERQIALFSATMPSAIRDIAKNYLNDPVKITIKAKAMTADSIRQRALFVSPREKLDTLKRILEAEETDGVIVFTKTKESTTVVAEKLCREGLKAVALNGDMPQRTRERTIERLKGGHLNILVATDVAARGLDVTRVSHVFNYDLPHDSQSYVHRIGRTGRAGRKGEAIIFLTGGQRHKLKMIEKATRQRIEVVDLPSVDEINAMRVKRFSERIAATLENEKATNDLIMFKKMIMEYAEESGQPLEQIAAALANNAQQGRPFLMKERPKREREERRGRDRDSDGDGRGKRRNQNRKSGPPAEGMIRYRIQVGWRDGVKPGNIVGAIANEAGIEGKYIGPIDINHGYSTIDLPEGMPKETFRMLQRCWVSGRQLRISVDGEEPARREGRGYKGKRRDGSKPKGKSNSKGKAFSGRHSSGSDSETKSFGGKSSGGKDSGSKKKFGKGSNKGPKKGLKKGKGKKKPTRT